MGVAMVSIIAAGTTFSGSMGIGYKMGMPGAVWTFSWAFAALMLLIAWLKIGRDENSQRFDKLRSRNPLPFL